MFSRRTAVNGWAVEWRDDTIYDTDLPEIDFIQRECCSCVVKLREYDKELEDFDGRLIELPITFVPSYPFEEDVEQGTSYMQTRVPAWCDRVLLSPAAQKLVQNVSIESSRERGLACTIKKYNVNLWWKKLINFYSLIVVTYSSIFACCT